MLTWQLRHIQLCLHAGMDLIGIALWHADVEPQFMHVFTRKGRFEDLMKRIPVHVITTRAALLGAATYGLERMAEGEENK